MKKKILSIVLLILSFSCAAGKDSYQSVFLDLNKDYPGTQKKFKKLVLENKLEVLLISDPEAQRSSAALSVRVGHLENPVEYPGLAHFLEHMLFLGTEKYPDADEYDRYLGDHLGSSNAYTDSEETNYQFVVSQDAFAGALDRFSQFFKSPLFNPEYVERERNAVNSEHQKNVQNSNDRFWRMLETNALGNHPESRFSTGNNETLAKVTRKTLVNFFEQHYSANLMKLALRSNLNLNELETLVREHFSGIKNNDLPIPQYNSEVFDKTKLPLLIQYKAIGAEQSLDLVFEQPSAYSYVDSRPQSFLNYLISQGGEGSLQSLLKREGLAHKISVSNYFLSYAGKLIVSMDLTDKGVKNTDQIIGHFFSFIEHLKKEGLKERSYLEQKKMTEIDYAYQSPTEGFDDVMFFSSTMQNMPALDIDKKTALYYKFSPADFKTFLDKITPTHMVVLQTQKNIQTDKKEKYYQIDYRTAKLSDQQLSQWLNSPLRQSLNYPAKNKFIPDSISLLNSDKNKTPYKLIDDDRGVFWFMQDKELHIPKAKIVLTLVSNKISSSPQHKILSLFYIMALEEDLKEWLDPIGRAGVELELSTVPRGVILAVSGYSDKLVGVLTELFGKLQNIQISNEVFSDIKEKAERDFNDFLISSAFEQNEYHIFHIIDKNSIHRDDLPSFQSIKLEELKDYAKHLYEKVALEAVAYGNLEPQKMREITNQLYKKLNAGILPPSERLNDDIVKLADGESWAYISKTKSDNNSWVEALFVGQKTDKLEAILRLATTHLQPKFYSDLRTNEQLGYQLYLQGKYFKKVLGLSMAIQSGTYDPVYLADRAKLWLKESVAAMNKITEEQLSTYKKSLIEWLSEKDRSIEDWYGYIHYAAFYQNGNLNFRKDLIKAIEKVKLEDIVMTLNQAIDPKNIKTIDVYLAAEGKKKPEIKEPLITDVMEFKKKRGVF